MTTHSQPRTKHRDGEDSSDEFSSYSSYGDDAPIFRKGYHNAPTACEERGTSANEAALSDLVRTRGHERHLLTQTVRATLAARRLRNRASHGKRRRSPGADLATRTVPPYCNHSVSHPCRYPFHPPTGFMG